MHGRTPTALSVQLGMFRTLKDWTVYMGPILKFSPKLDPVASFFFFFIEMKEHS